MIGSTLTPSPNSRILAYSSEEAEGAEESNLNPLRLAILIVDPRQRFPSDLTLRGLGYFDQVMHLHLALTAEANSMRVSWVTGAASQSPAVRYRQVTGGAGSWEVRRTAFISVTPRVSLCLAKVLSRYCSAAPPPPPPPCALDDDRSDIMMTKWHNYSILTLICPLKSCRPH